MSAVMSDRRPYASSAAAAASSPGRGSALEVFDLVELELSRRPAPYWCRCGAGKRRGLPAHGYDDRAHSRDRDEQNDLVDLAFWLRVRIPMAHWI
jgi:hypothetical protein